MRCPFCGAEVTTAKTSTCEYCDSDLTEFIRAEKESNNIWPQPFPGVNKNYCEIKPQGKSRQTALILCIIGLFGIGGLHRLYVGKIGTGILHLFTHGLFWVGTLIDLVLIATDNFTDSSGNKLV